MFRTKISIENSENKLTYNSSILSMGSCFAENIGSKLKDTFFDIDINPFGVLFNPVSILQSINYLRLGYEFTNNDLFKHGSLWCSFAHSTLFSDINPDNCLLKINSRLWSSKTKFSNIDFLFITFGTAWMYKHEAKSIIVANCHKIPSSSFERIRLSAIEIYQMYNTLITELKEQNPKLQIVFTVSPVRHWKDGPTENNISKGILLDAVQQLVAGHANVHYFPAYEIVLDELRDYRFYAPDMLHPSEMAVNYIFDLFRDNFFSADTLVAYKEIQNFVQQIKHKPLHPDTLEYKQFYEKLKLTENELINKYPFLSSRLNESKSLIDY